MHPAGAEQRVTKWHHHLPGPVQRAGRVAIGRWTQWQRRRPVRLGSLRRLSPIDPHWGFNRGQPVDRYYINTFLRQHAADITGRVLEIGSPKYTLQYGSNLTSIEVLNIDEGEPTTTIVADLADAPQVPSDSFDCALITQTLHLIYDFRAALETLHRSLAPGGVLLLTVPGITKTSQAENEPWYWSFTERSIRRLLSDVFGDGRVEVQTFGNVLSATAFLYGLAEHELKAAELTHHDPAFEVIIGARAVK